MYEYHLEYNDYDSALHIDDATRPFPSKRFGLKETQCEDALITLEEHFSFIFPTATSVSPAVAAVNADITIRGNLFEIDWLDSPYDAECGGYDCITDVVIPTCGDPLNPCPLGQQQHLNSVSSQVFPAIPYDTEIIPYEIASVRIGEFNAVNFEVVNNRTLVVQVPQGVGSKLDVQVAFYSGSVCWDDIECEAPATYYYTNLARAFSYPNPAITSVSDAILPTVPPACGGVLTITGTGFYSPAEASIGSRKCLSTNVISGTQIECAYPAGVEVDLNVVVVFTSTTGTTFRAVLPSAVSYAAPVIESVTNPVVDIDGEIPITIVGSGFGAKKPRVSVGGKVCPIISFNDTEAQWSVS